MSSIFGGFERVGMQMLEDTNNGWRQEAKVVKCKRGRVLATKKGRKLRRLHCPINYDRNIVEATN